jgi:hypothetical protein
MIDGMGIRGMKKQLFPHQKIALEKMETREKTKQITAFHYEIDLLLGIYADMAGFGKTVTMIGLMLRDKMEWNTNEDLLKSSIINVYGNGYILKRSRTFYHRIKTNLVVATPIVLNQWRDELEETSLRYAMVTNKQICNQVDPTDLDVLLTVPTFYNKIIDRFPNCAWKRFLYDDPTHCKIASMRPLVAGYIWMLSATPEMLLYQHRSGNNFMSSIFSSNLDYNIYKHLIIKNPDDFVKESFHLPPCQSVIHECHEPLVWIIRDLISPTILDMVSAGNIEGAIKSMGGTSTSNIFDLVIRGKQEALRQADWKIARWKLYASIDSSGNDVRLGSSPGSGPGSAPAPGPGDVFTGGFDFSKKQKWEMKRERILYELSELRQRIHRVLKENKCHICFEPFQEPVVLNCCQNIFCGECILKWISNTNVSSHSTCPLCRHPLTSDCFVYMKNTIQMMESIEDNHNQQQPVTTTDNNQDKNGGPMLSKIDTLSRILCSYPEGRFIIFSSYDDTFRHIRDVLKGYEIEYGEMSGKRHEHRSRVIREFKNNNINVLFMNSNHDGAGVNLQEATDIILYHEMSELIKTQIIGRAYRIGRKLPLRVHYLQSR